MQFPLDIGIQEMYADIEIDDFAKLIEEDTLIEKCFGQTLKVTSSVNMANGQMKREVKEFKELAILPTSEQKEASEQRSEHAIP